MFKTTVSAFALLAVVAASPMKPANARNGGLGVGLGVLGAVVATGIIAQQQAAVAQQQQYQQQQFYYQQQQQAAAATAAANAAAWQQYNQYQQQHRQAKTARANTTSQRAAAPEGAREPAREVTTQQTIMRAISQ